MVKRRKRKRRKAKSRFWLLLVPLIAVGVLIVAWRVGVKSHRKQSSPVRRSEERLRPPRASLPVNSAVLSRRLRLAMIRAGGDGLWIRGESSLGALDVIAAEAVYPAAAQAVICTARAEGLRVAEADLSGHPGEMRSTRITASEAGEPVFACTLHEVPRIPRIAIVVDDLGQSLTAAQNLLRLREPLTFSVMPHLRYSRETAEEAHQDGIEVMLHLPMQPVVDSAPDVSPHELKVGMVRGQVDEIIRSDLETVPYAAGVNNHMGSRATTDARLMREVMAELSARRLFYIDSRTISGSLALAAAWRSGVPAFYRSVFLDDTRSIPYTLGQLHELCRIAARQGVALAIGHPYPTTLAALARFLPQLERGDVELVSASTLLRQPDSARLSPGRSRKRRGGL